MADFRSCIDAAVTEGEIDAETGQLAREAYDDARAVGREMFGDVEADRYAAEAVMRKLEAEKIEARRRRQMMIRERRKLVEDMAAFKSRRGYGEVQALGGGGDGRPPKGGWVQGGKPPEDGPGSKGAAAAAFLERKIENRPGLQGAEGASMAGQHRVIVGQAHALLADVIERFESRSGLALRKHRAVSENVVREAHGIDTGDLAAKGYAEAWKETSEWLRLKFNAAGGAIGKLDGWAFPQRHDAIRVRDIGRDAWVERITPLLDRGRMVDRVTGQPFTEPRLKAVLGEVWDSIASNGASRTEPGAPTGKGMVAKQRGEERFLIFDGPENWLAYQRQFGEGDVFQAMLGHVDDMAIDIAQMEVFGPNPRAQFDWMADFALREARIEEANGAVGAAKKAERQIETARRMYEHLTGNANVAMRPTVAQVGATTRSALNGVMLGSAVLGEVGSAPYFGRMARAFNGLDRNGDVSELVRLLALPSERAIARRSGFIIEQATDGFIRGTQDNLRLLTTGDRAQTGLNAFARRLPAFTLRSTLLTPIVAARKRAFRFEFMGRLHDVRDRTLADLRAGDADDRTLADWMTARGFSEADWTIIRAAPVWEPRQGARFLRPADVADERLAQRLAEGIELETRFMTPETTLWTRAKLTGVDQPGTVAGETRRSWAMMRGFTLTATNLYAAEVAARGWAKAGSAKGMIGYAAAMAAHGLLFLTIGGAVNIQLREIAKGNDPRPMGDARFWGQAALTGGGLGIFGDFLYATEARNGKTSPIVAAGPTGQLVSDLYGLSAGNVLEVAGDLSAGDDLDEAVGDARIGRDAAGLVRDYNPLATNWMTRAAYSRLVADNVQRALDPDAEDQWRRAKRRMERERGQSQWWESGQGAPSRAPDLAAMGEAVPPS